MTRQQFIELRDRVAAIREEFNEIPTWAVTFGPEISSALNDAENLLANEVNFSDEHEHEHEH